MSDEEEPPAADAPPPEEGAATAAPPPPSETKGPSEAEAWKSMMESMTVFIGASTQLMNTIQAKKAAEAKKKCPGHKEKDCVCTDTSCAEKSK